MPAGGGHLVQHSGTAVWLTIPGEATACLHMPAKTWVLQSLLPKLSFCHAPSLLIPAPHLMPAPPGHLPRRRMLWARCHEGAVGRPHSPIAAPLSPSH